MGGVGAEEEASGRAMTSSMVEAVFMLLQKSGVRGIDMYSGSVANMLLNHVIQEVLGEYGSYRGALNAQWRRTSEALARGEDENGAQSICSLNNIAVSADYVMRLCAELSGQAHKTLRAAELKQTQALLDEMRRLAEAWEAESTSLLQGLYSEGLCNESHQWLLLIPPLLRPPFPHSRPLLSQRPSLRSRALANRHQQGR